MTTLFSSRMIRYLLEPSRSWHIPSYRWRGLRNRLVFTAKHLYPENLLTDGHQEWSVNFSLRNPIYQMISPAASLRLHVITTKPSRPWPLYSTLSSFILNLTLESLQHVMLRMIQTARRYFPIQEDDYLSYRPWFLWICSCRAHQHCLHGCEATPNPERTEM